MAYDVVDDVDRASLDAADVDRFLAQIHLRRAHRVAVDAKPSGIERLLRRPADDRRLALIADDGGEGHPVLIDNVDGPVAGYHRDEAVGRTEVETHRHHAPPSSALSCCNSFVSASM